MADHDSTAVSEHEQAGGDESVPSRAGAVGSIEDPIVRRMVGFAVHVRGYAPYYVATLALFAFLLFGPRPHSSPDDAAFSADQAAARADTGAGSGRATGGAGAGAASAVTSGMADAVVAGTGGTPAFDSLLADATVSAALARDAAGAGVPEAPSAPDAPDVADFDPDEFAGGDVDYGSEKPDTCTVALPSPAPSVSPSRESQGLQTTAEAAAGAELPVDAAPYAEDVATTTGCPSVSGGTPDLPVPLPIGLPV